MKDAAAVMNQIINRKEKHLFSLLEGAGLDANILVDYIAWKDDQAQLLGKERELAAYEQGYQDACKEMTFQQPA